MSQRLVALIKQVDRADLYAPRALFLEEKGGCYYLFYLDIQGKFLTDTWHQSLEKAKDQAKLEYENVLGEWIEVPPEVDDIRAFVVEIEDKS